jgi:hypothetical protein
LVVFLKIVGKMYALERWFFVEAKTFVLSVVEGASVIEVGRKEERHLRCGVSGHSVYCLAGFKGGGALTAL